MGNLQSAKPAAFEISPAMTDLQAGALYYYPNICHRLIRSHPVSGKVRQQTLLNLGRHFSIPRQDWPLLCRRLDEFLGGQLPLLPRPTTQGPAGALEG